MEYVLKTFNLSKKYKNKLAVNKACMNIEKGEIYGFVGANGSGKTTLIRLISGLIFPHMGEFELFGVNSRSPEIVKARKKLGAIVESPSIYRNMSAYDNLKMQCTLLGTDESLIDSVLCEVGLSDMRNDKKHAGDFSLGMRQRLGIAMALLSDPMFLILDEPMNGLDPAGIVSIRELILRLNREKGITFLISSHMLSELALVATKYGIISEGTVIEEITAEELRRRCGMTVSIASDTTDTLYTELCRILPAEQLSYTPDGVKITGDIVLNDVLSALIDAGVNLTSINCSKMSFEEYYLSKIRG